MDNQLNKVLSLASASFVLGVSPSYASSPSNAQLYGQIQGNGTLWSGSAGILSVTHPATGYYCIKPSSATLQNAASAGTLGVQLTPRSTTGTAVGVFVVQLYGTNKAKHCQTDEVAVTIVREVNFYCTPAPSGTGASVTSPSGTYCGYESYNADFTVLFE